MRTAPLLAAVAALVLVEAPANAQAAKDKADDLLKQGIDSSQRGDGVEALCCLLQARSLYRQMGDHRSEAATMEYLGTIYEYLGEKEKAVNGYKQLAIQGAGPGQPCVHDDPSPPELRG